MKLIRSYTRYLKTPVKKEYSEGFKMFVDRMNLSLVPVTAQLGLLFFLLLTILDIVRFSRGELIGNVHNMLLLVSHSFMALNAFILFDYYKKREKYRAGSQRHGRKLVIYILAIVGASLMLQAVLTLQTRDTIYTTAIFMLIVNLVFHLTHRSRIIINLVCFALISSVIIVVQWADTEILIINLLEYLGVTVPSFIFATFHHNMLGREFSYENALKEKNELIQSEFTKKVTRLKMDALQAQMNPHFIFNCLNSIDYYILKNDPDKASDYLNRFSKLIRLILKNSRSTTVTLQDELDALQLYVDLEQLRFSDVFRFDLIMPGINPNQYNIPPMLLQPYVENAIWHGLMHKEGKKWIRLEISKTGDYLVFTVEDNGIGRKRSAELKSKSATQFKSMGMRLTKSRLEILNKIYHRKANVNILDKSDDLGNATGTRVTIYLPV